MIGEAVGEAGNQNRLKGFWEFGHFNITCKGGVITYDEYGDRWEANRRRSKGDG